MTSLFLTLSKLELLKHLSIDNPYFDSIVNRICPPELQLNKSNIFLTLSKLKLLKHLSLHVDIWTTF